MRFDSIEKVSDIKDFFKFKNILREVDVDNYAPASQISVDGILFDLDSIIVVDCNTSTIEFGHVKYIIVSKTTNDIIFIYLKLINNGYVNQFAAYNVTCTEDWEKKSFENLCFTKMPYDLYQVSNGLHYVLCEI